MSKIIAKITILCWGFVVVFAAFLTVAMAIPAGAVFYVSAVFGFLILGLIAVNIQRIYRAEGFDFGWFLTVKKGYWRILAALFGASLFLFGLGGLIIPEITNDLAEQHWMKFASVLIILFWTALTSTFLGWEMICLSEAVGYVRLGKIKSAFGAFALGILWLGFASLFLYLFLGVVNDIFFSLSLTAQYRILGCFAVLSVIAGLIGGKFEDLKLLENENKPPEADV